MPLKALQALQALHIQFTTSLLYSTLLSNSLFISLVLHYQVLRFKSLYQVLLIQIKVSFYSSILFISVPLFPISFWSSFQNYTLHNINLLLRSSAALIPHLSLHSYPPRLWYQSGAGSTWADESEGLDAGLIQQRSRVAIWCYAKYNFEVMIKTKSKIMELKWTK